jgi:predicted membrane chloride channel (bestrophin family)
MWVSSVNWGVLLVVIALQTLLTWAVFYTSDTQGKPCRGFCNSYITIDFSTHNLTGVAIFFLLGFRSSNSYSRFWEVGYDLFAS